MNFYVYIIKIRICIYHHFPIELDFIILYKRNPHGAYGVVSPIRRFKIHSNKVHGRSPYLFVNFSILYKELPQLVNPAASFILFFSFLSVSWHSDISS